MLMAFRKLAPLHTRHNDFPGWPLPASCLPARPCALPSGSAYYIREQVDMSLFQRAHDIVAAKANKALDSAENPTEMLDYSYEQMLDHITKVRQALVDIAASRKRIELQEQQLQQSIAHLQDQAQAALALGNEDLAREALSRKAAAQQQIDGMEPQHQELTEQEHKLEQTLSQLQQRVNTFRSQKEVMKAQYIAAKATASVSEETAGISKSFGDSGAALQRAQDKIASMQARAGAMDELLQSGVLEDLGGDTDDIQKELDEAGSAARVDQELAAMKTQLASTPAPSELTAGSSPATPSTASG
jgi:phage shock protein A